MVYFFYILVKNSLYYCYFLEERNLMLCEIKILSLF